MSRIVRGFASLAVFLTVGRVLLCVALIALFLSVPGSLQAGITGSPHDFSATGPWTQSTEIAPSGACSSCHVPHSAQDNILWSRSLSGYKTKLDQRDGKPSSEPNYLLPPSLQCYDCHDYHSNTDFESLNVPRLPVFRVDHRPQDILFGFTKNSLGSMTEYNAGSQTGKTVPGFYETNPVGPGSSPNYGVNLSAPLSETGGHYFKQDPTTSTGDAFDNGDKLPCRDCHDPHTWDSLGNWQAFFRNNWPTGSRVPTYLGTVVRASSYMANESTPTVRRDDPYSRKLCTACHGTSDGQSPVNFNEINAVYRNVAITSPPNTVGQHATASQVACVSCHAHNSVGASCSQCHGYPPSDTANPRYPSIATSTFVPSPDPGANDSHPRHYGAKSGQSPNSFSPYSFSCDVCHYGSAGAGASSLNQHNNAYVSVVIQGAYTKAGGTYDNTNYYNARWTPITYTAQLDNSINTNKGWGWTNGDKGWNTCRNVYCHSAGRVKSSMADNEYRIVLWNSGQVHCNDCHGIGTDNVANGGINWGMPSYPSGAAGSDNANSHYVHVVTNSYECYVCHSATVTTGTGASRAIRTDVSPTRHVNGSRDVVFDGTNATGTYDNTAGVKTCSVNCHGSGTPQWGGAALKCGSCHLASGDSDQYQSLTNVWFANDTIGTIDNTEWLYSGHGKGTGTYDVSSHPAANFPGGAGSGDPCYYCHDASVVHKQAANPFRLKNQTGVSGYSTKGWNATCLVCHSKTTSPPGYQPDVGYTLKVADNTDRVDTAHYGSKHSQTDNTSGGYFCWDCHDPHGDRSNSTTGNIYMIQKVALAKTDGVYGYRGTAGENTALVTFQRDNTVQAGGDWARSDFRGICQVCHHGNGTGSSTQAKYYTQSAFQNHNQDKVCTSCHSHNQNFGATCNSCHGETSGVGVNGMPPYAPYQSHPWTSGTTVDNLSSLAGIGNHRTATGVVYSSHETFGCEQCHTSSPGQDALHDTGKDNASLTQVPLRTWNWAGGPLAGAYSYGTLAGGAAGGSVTDDSCSNIDCHSPRYGSNSYKSGTPFPYTRYWINSTLWDCYACHGYDGTTATTRPGGAAAARIDTGSHTKHVASPASLACTACHVNNAGNNWHKTGGVDFIFPAFGPYASTRTYSRNGAVPTDNASLYGSCSNLYCHSVVQTSTGGPLIDNNATHYKTPAWGNAASGQCGACHDDDPNTAGGTGTPMSSGSHLKHIDNNAQYKFSCTFCHNGAGEGTALHVNGAINVGISGALPFKPSVTGTYAGDNVPGNGNFGKCASVYCHGGAGSGLSGGVNQATDNTTWGNASTAACGTCHGAPGGAAKGASDYPTSGAHARHMSASDLAGPRITSCADCHASETASSHVNGRVDFRKSYTDNTATALDNTSTCDPCHALGVATAKANWVSVGALDCLTCHGSTPAYTYANATGRIAPNVAGDNTNYGSMVLGHNRTGGNYPASNNPAANRACGDCHKLTLTHIDNVDGTTYSGNRLSDNVNGVTGLATISGLCAACHTTASTTATNNKINTHGNTSASFKALSTHDNNAEDFAYNCDACHEPHGMTNNGRSGASANIYMIKRLIEVKNYNVPGTGADNTTTVGPVYLESRTGTNSFDDGASGSSRLCVACHASASRPGSSTALTNSAGDGTHSGLNDYSSNEQGKDCSMCHSHNLDDNNATVDGLMPQACNACHSYPGLGGTYKKQMSGTHNKHVGSPTDTANSRQYRCTMCHYNYSHNGNQLNPGDNWSGTYYTFVNVDFDPAVNEGSTVGAKYRGIQVPTTGNGVTNASTCEGIYCHGNKASQSTWGGTTSATPPKWDNSVSAACGTCHGASSTMPQGNHPAHLAATYGPQIAASTCVDGTGCHTSYGLNPATAHAGGTVDFLRYNTTSDNVAVLLGATGVCRNCHSRYTSAYVPIAGDNLVRTQANWNDNNFKVPCVTCHNNAADASSPPDSQGVANRDGTGNRAPNIEVFYFSGGGHGDNAIDNTSTASSPATLSCASCHDATFAHIGTAKNATNPWRLSASTGFVLNGGLDNNCAGACHSASAPANHAWRVNVTSPVTAETKATADTHPTSTLAVGTNKDRWYRVANDNNIPLQGNLTQSPHTRVGTENIVCVSCHDPHGVGAAVLSSSVRNFSGQNTEAAKKMLRFNYSNADNTQTPLCTKCHI